MIPITRPELPPLADYVHLLERIWSTRMLSNFGEFSQALEKIASDYLRTGARAVVSGDVGLVCAISCLELPAGTTCLVPSFTFNSTINAVLWNDLIPVFVDIDPETFCMDPDAAAAAAERCGPSLIVATHVFGNPCDADRLGALARRHDARLLFDAAHGYGSRRGDTPVGGLGDVEVFSLSGTKPVTCAEGGLVTSRDQRFLERFEYARAYGFQHDYNSRVQGMNGKMSELHAALGTLTLPTIDAVLEHRFGQIATYRRLLAGVEGIRFQNVRAEDRSTFKDLAIVFDDPAARDRCRDELAKQEIQTKLYFRPCHRMDAFFAFADEPLPATDEVYDRILCLPLYASLDDRTIESICSTVRAAAIAGVAAAPAR
ncbi:MAG: DegT/DnrJ/EryC1/StrS family aminotransferase [Planctomycetes bacterium]|nr:DegT/DnrJ/EryC1/StrS family aminotransferase [Planctomycetota bacterium]